ncbi:hypothetical protein [Marinibacterium sp. SX1]|uniref:hypothetical protein n=1 Tax=Marinibacterium sp. SX1 TaxID=3388424 RepID=UPI003D173820
MRRRGAAATAPTAERTDRNDPLTTEILALSEFPNSHWEEVEDRMKAMGCFTEVIQWKTRVFIPVDGIDVLSRVLAEHPVGASAADAAA